MSYLRDVAIVLRHEPYREHDGWVTLYGREHGKLVAVARGVRKPSAKHLGHLEPLARAEVMIAKGAAFDKIAVARRLCPHRGLQAGMGGWSVGGAFVDFLDQVTRPGMPDPAVYDTALDLLDALDGMPEHPTPVRALSLYAASVLKTLARLGYAMDAEACAGCRKILHEETWWSGREASLFCLDCMRERRRVDQTLEKLPSDVPKILRFMGSAAFVDVLRLTAETASLRAAASAVFGLAVHAGLPIRGQEPVRFSALLEPNIDHAQQP